MTTVINYNVLNFFTIRLNSIAPGDGVRSYNQHPDDGARTYPREKDEFGDIIDVTSYSRTIDDEDSGVRIKRTEKNIDLAGTSKIETLYGWQGKPVHVGHAKGLFVDIYV